MSDPGNHGAAQEGEKGDWGLLVAPPEADHPATQGGSSEDTRQSGPLRHSNMTRMKDRYKENVW